MKELTQQELAKVFGLYFGCEVRVQESWMAKLYGVTGGPGKFIKCRVVLYGTSTGKWYDIEDCKLILCPLSKITNEDAVEFYDQRFPNNIRDESAKAAKASVGKSLAREPLTYQDADFLRSKGYALPWMGYDLFAAGIAIEKEVQP